MTDLNPLLMWDAYAEAHGAIVGYNPAITLLVFIMALCTLVLLQPVPVPVQTERRRSQSGV
ncbi:MAG: hypothetical protein Q7S66_02470 [bacterium]|nr:hypothetical protein [bacterium]